MAEVIEADLTDPAQAQAVLDLLDQYAQEPTGGGAMLGEQVRRDVIPALQRRQDALILLAVREGWAPERIRGLLDLCGGAVVEYS